MTTGTIPLGELVTIRGGGTPSRSISAYWNGAIRWATVKDFKSTELAETEESITPEGINKSATNVIPAGSVIVPTRMAVGKAAINTIDLAINQDLKALLPGRNVDARFLLHFMVSQGKYLESQAQGATVKGIKLDLLRSLPFPEISPSEQRRIASILDKADAIRRKREQSLALADDFLRSVFLEIFGDPSANHKGHPIQQFGTILLLPLRNGISPSSKGNISANVLTLTAITGERFDADQSKEGKFLEPISAKDTVSRSDFYICRGNGSPDLIGRGYFADRDMGGTAFPDTMIAAKPNPRKVTRAYLEKLWNSPFIRNQIREAARTTNGTFKINQTAAGAIKIPIPPLSDQTRYQAIVDQVGQAMSKLAYGDDLFPALSQRAFRGEL